MDHGDDTDLGLIFLVLSILIGAFAVLLFIAVVT